MIEKLDNNSTFSFKLSQSYNLESVTGFCLAVTSFSAYRGRLYLYFEETSYTWQPLSKFNIYLRRRTAEQISRYQCLS